MQLEDIMASGHAMQTVDILRDKREGGNATLNLDQGIVTWIRSHTFEGLAAPRIPIPDELRIAMEGLWRGQILRAVLGPEACLRIPEGAETTLLRDAGAGQDRDAPGGSQPFNQIWREWWSYQGQGAIVKLLRY